MSWFWGMARSFGCIWDTELLLRNDKTQNATHKNVTYICLFQFSFPRLLSRGRAEVSLWVLSKWTSGNIRLNTESDILLLSPFSLWRYEWAGADGVWYGCVCYVSIRLYFMFAHRKKATPPIVVSKNLVCVWDGGQNIQPLLQLENITWWWVYL